MKNAFLSKLYIYLYENNLYENTHVPEEDVLISLYFLSIWRRQDIQNGRVTRLADPLLNIQ